MARKKIAAGEIRTSPAACAARSQAMPATFSQSAFENPANEFAVAMVAARYGLPLPWAAIVAAAAGLGERLP